MPKGGKAFLGSQSFVQHRYGGYRDNRKYLCFRREDVTNVKLTDFSLSYVFNTCRLGLRVGGITNVSGESEKILFNFIYFPSAQFISANVSLSY